MTFIKTFESFKISTATYMYVANPEAEKALMESEIFEMLEESNGFFIGESIDAAVEYLTSEGFTSPHDFSTSSSLNEALAVKYEGHKTTPDGVELSVKINGHDYSYGQKKDDLDIGDIARKFEKMLQFSAGKALSWLKKHTVLVKGETETEKKDLDTVKESHEEAEEMETSGIPVPEAPESSEAPEIENTGEDLKNYMFFQNLKTMKRHIDMMLGFDQHTVDELLSNGNDWASDHISTAKDDTDEVCEWLCNHLQNS